MWQAIKTGIVAGALLGVAEAMLGDHPLKVLLGKPPVKIRVRVRRRPAIEHDDIWGEATR